MIVLLDSGCLLTYDRLKWQNMTSMFLQHRSRNSQLERSHDEE